MNVLCNQLLYLNDSKEEKKKKKKKEKQSHSQFTTVFQRHHKRIQLKQRGRCKWGRRHSSGCTYKRSNKRKFGTDVTELAINSVNEPILEGSLSHYRCSKCQIWLCIQGDCWQQYHQSIEANS